MIGENKSLKEIFQGVEKDMDKKIKDTELMDEVNRIFPLLEEVGVLLLRNKKINIVPMK